MTIPIDANVAASQSPRRGVKALLTIVIIIEVLWLIATIWSGGASGWQQAWPIAVAMVFGSFLAGATSEGGGAIAFPVLTLLFAVDPSDARDFAWMIQAVGMNAAGFVIWRSGTPVIREIILPATAGGALGVVCGLYGFSGRFDPVELKLGFTSIWLAFGGVLLWTLRTRQTRLPQRASALGVFVVAVLGGAVSSQFGTGLDICVFSWLVLRCGADERIATPTSVILMGLNALFGVAVRVFQAAPISAEVLSWWWACVPIVVIGAPLGARWLRGKSRRLVVCLLLASIVAQYAGALALLPMTGALAGLSAALILSFAALFAWMTRA